MKRDKMKSTTQAAYKTPQPPAAYKTPHTRSAQDAATSRKANIQICQYTGRGQEPNGSYWCNARGVGTVDRGNRPTRGDFQRRFQQWPTLKRTPDMEEHDIDEPSAAACKRTKEPRYCSQSISGVVDGGISREGSHKGQMYSKLNSTCEMP